MLRQRRTERRERLRSRELENLAQPIRQRLMRWAEDHSDDLAQATPTVPQALDDRAADGWEPLLAIADAAGDRWPERARRLAVSYSSERAEDEREAPGVLLLVDLGELIKAGTLLPDQHGYAATEMTRVLHALPTDLGRAGGGATRGLSRKRRSGDCCDPRCEVAILRPSSPLSPGRPARCNRACGHPPSDGSANTSTRQCPQFGTRK